MKDYFLYLIVRLIGFILRLFPLRALLWAGRRLGDLAYYSKKRRAQVALVNLKAALGSVYNHGELKAIAKKTFQNLGQILVEIINFPKFDLNYINKYVTFKGTEHIDQALKKGKGVIHLTAHLGNWELSSFANSLNGYPLKVFAREQKYLRLNRLLNQYRELSGCKVVLKGMALRNLIRSLHNNEIIGMLGDQNAGPSGILIPFFNRLASTAPGAIALALKTKAALLPTFMIRKDNIYHYLIIEGPLELEDSGETDLDIKKGLEKFNLLLEKYIIRHPDQWLWVHKRWKRTPNRSVVILSDGKAGHLKQAQALLKDTQELSSPELINKKVIEVKFKSKTAKALLPLFNILSNFTFLGTRLYLKWALDKQAFMELEKTFADIVVSCGASLSLVNLYLARENKAKAVVIMKPSLIRLKKFDLAIVPAHDCIRPQGNTVISLGALTSVGPKAILEQAGRLKNKFNLSQKNKIGLLLGGDTKRHYFKKEDINRLIDELTKVSTQLDLGLLVTTSRRTSRVIERLLKKRLSNFKNCELLIIANENNVSGAVEGILGLSEAVVVSAESISMLAEAVSSGRKVVAFEPKLKKLNFIFGADKQKLFLHWLIKEGFVATAEINRLAEVIEAQENNKILDNQANLLAGLRRIW